MSVPSARTITVQAPGRLHLGFLDPDASLGRRFGSLGLVIDDFATEIELSAADRSQDRVLAVGPATACDVERAGAHLQALRRHTGIVDGLQLRLLRTLPAHAGLGSGTQLALAVGRAFARFHGLQVDTPTLARWLGRGARSGVGIGGFDHGGLLLDGGPGVSGPAPLLSRVAWPASWAVLVVQDPRQRGLSGAAERAAIAALEPLSQRDAADLCHQVLMRILPGAADADFATFARGVDHVQRLLGEHFAAQQGGAFTSAAVGHFLQWVSETTASERDHAAGELGAAIGQSSWGPTGFAFLPSRACAQTLVDAARALGVVDSALELRIVGARNQGASVIEREFAPSVV